jgi:hypothetical protein
MKVFSILFLSSLFVLISSISVNLRKKQDFFDASFNAKLDDAVNSLNNTPKSGFGEGQASTTSVDTAAVKETAEKINRIDFGSFGQDQNTGSLHSTINDVPTTDQKQSMNDINSASHDVASKVNNAFSGSWSA